MSEEEKLEKGLLYDANNDNSIREKIVNAQRICFKYNNIEPSDVKKREEIIEELIKDIGENYVIEQPFFCDYGYRIKIGKNFYSNHNLCILDAGHVEIGDNVFIGPNVGIYTSSHPLEVELRNKGLETAEKIVIGNNVWIGGNVVILPGVTIGDNVTIGAGSVVTKDIPNDSLAYGNPCRVARKI